MRIALDATYGAGKELTGVGVYSREIADGLAASRPGDSFALCYRPHRLRAALRDALRRNQHRRLLTSWGPLTRADLYHGLNQRMPRRRMRRAVSTFHDLFVMTGEYSTPAFRQRFAEQAREAAQSSDLIICVSAFTASQVEALLGVEKSRLRVIHHGVRPPAEPPADAMRQRMVLCVGSIQKRKNMTRLVQAFSRTAPGWRLVLAGGAGFAAEETFAAIAESPRREDIRVTGYVSEQALARLYSQASLFAFPSLDEGFGIPVLEAMAWGVPVLTSDHAALREVSGGAALLANPHDVESIRHALQRMMDDEDLRCSLAKQGHTWSAGFRWDNAVSQTWRVYEELL